MADIKAVIFDLDGTLYDKSRLPFRLIIRQILHGKLFMLKRERSVRKELKGKYFGNGEKFEEAFFANFQRKNAKKWYYEIYMPDTIKILKKHYHIAPWVEDCFMSLRNKGIKIAIFSDYGCVEEKLNAIGFDCQWADYIFDAPSLGGLKPCKESFLKVCNTMEISPQNCLMVGDRDDTDGAGATATGMLFQKINLKDKKTINPIIDWEQ